MDSGEKERVRVRERGTMEDSTYERSIREYSEFQNRQMTAKIVVKSTDNDWETNRQSTIKRYLTTFGQDTVLGDWTVFIHDIKTHSGRHRHQGGLVIFVLEGQGGTEVDGEKVPWQANDLILLPIKPGGVEHKHFNSDLGKGCKWMAFIYKPFSFLLSSEMVQLEVAPEFSRDVSDPTAFVTGKIENTTGTKIFDGEDLSALYRSRRGYGKENGGGKELDGYYGELIRLRDRQRQLRRKARWIIQGNSLSYENNPQGIMRWYTHPAMEDIVIHTMLFFMQEIPPGSRSGKQLHPGNQVNYILDGKGHTVIDGVKHSWAAGDVVQLPIRKDGVVFQHFNDDPTNKVRLVACEPNFLFTTGVDRGAGFEQLEPSPDFEKTLN